MKSINDVDYNDEKTWALYHEGRTKGLFQLESNLGRSWSKRVKPSNRTELAALVSILRPGCIKAISDGKSMSQHYVDRKHGKEEVKYLHESLEDILQETYGVLIYQEQAMRIAQKLAGFSETEADVLRKAIGKKKADLMAEVRKDFIKGCESIGIVDAETADEIFGWIEKSARYSFNKCLSPSTLVETPNGLKELSELLVGDTVLCPSSDGDEFVEVLDVMNNGEKECFELELEDGETIQCTIDHKFLCSDGKKRPLFEILEDSWEIVCIRMQPKKIKSIKRIGYIPTMDIEVDNQSHVFYGNSIAVSNSHAVCYATDSYWSAYRKAHNTREFFLAYFQYASEKQDPHQEVYELASEAKLFDLELKTPNINNFKREFNAVKNTIYFGIKNIKSLTGKNGEKAEAAVEQMSLELNKKIQSISWLEILIYYSTKVNSTVFKTLASIGFFRGIKDKVSRNKALYEYEIFKIMTKTELAWVVENYPKKRWKTLKDCLVDLSPTKKEGGGTFKESRKQIILNEIKMLDSPPYDLDDDPEWVIDQEVKFLGCPVSMSKIGAADISGANTTCKEIVDGRKGKNLRLAANLVRVADFKIKKEGPNKGKNMAFLTVEDDSCSLDSVIVFPECREENKYTLFEGNNVMLHGSCEKDAFIVEKIFEI